MKGSVSSEPLNVVRTFVLMGIFVFYLQGRPGPKGDPGDSGLPGQKVSAGLAQAGKADYSLGLPR